MTKIKGQIFRDELRGAMVRWEDAENLLSHLWEDIGPYGEGKLTKDTLNEFRDFFDWSDAK